MNSEAMSEPVHVAVCACTYRRPQGLQQLLDGLAHQIFPHQQPIALTIVIADNEASNATRKICEAFSQRTEMPLLYVPVKERGISQARNACLDHLPAKAAFIAFIDDDEIPAADWLDQLLMMQARTKADVVYGPVNPVLPADAAAWLKEGDWFHKPRQLASLQDGQEIGFAATCNCLLRRAVIIESGLRFNPAFGLSGGEDKLFFRQLKAQGYRIVWSDKALVRETVPAERAGLKYLLSSEFRLGNVRLPVKMILAEDSGKKRYRLRLKAFLQAMADILQGASLVTGSVFHGRDSMTRLANGTCRISEGLGELCSVLGYWHRHYG